MSTVNFPARPWSKLMFVRSIHGDGLTSVAIVLVIVLSHPGAVITDSDGSVTILGSIVDGGSSIGALSV